MMQQIGEVLQSAMVQQERQLCASVARVTTAMACDNENTKKHSAHLQQ